LSYSLHIIVGSKFLSGERILSEKGWGKASRAVQGFAQPKRKGRGIGRKERKRSRDIISRGT